MAKNLDNMKRLCTKLQVRYGENDALVVQLKREIDSFESLELKHRNWSISYCVFIKADAAERCWDSVFYWIPRNQQFPKKGRRLTTVAVTLSPPLCGSPSACRPRNAAPTCVAAAPQNLSHRC